MPWWTWTALAFFVASCSPGRDRRLTALRSVSALQTAGEALEAASRTARTKSEELEQPR